MDSIKRGKDFGNSTHTTATVKTEKVCGRVWLSSFSSGCPGYLVWEAEL